MHATSVSLPYEHAIKSNRNFLSKLKQENLYE